MFGKIKIRAKDFRLKYLYIVIILSIGFAVGVLFYWDKIDKEMSFTDLPKIEILKKRK